MLECPDRVNGRPSTRQAQLTFAMARHALVDLAQIFALEPVTDMPDRLPEKEFQVLYDQMCQSGVAT